MPQNAVPLMTNSPSRVNLLNESGSEPDNPGFECRRQQRLRGMYGRRISDIDAKEETLPMAEDSEPAS